MVKLLFVSNVAKRVGSFSVASINAAHALNIDYFMAANWTTPIECQKKDESIFGIKIFNISLKRSPYSLSNIKAYKQLCKIIKDEHIDVIHCNTPVGGMLGRLAGAKCGVKKIIYQVHGFHFYKGAPKKNWLLYYPIERWLAHKTDALITINKEDYELAQQKFHLRKNGKVYYVPGVGIDTKAYFNDRTKRVKKREELGLDGYSLALISMGDLIERKNYPVAIEAVAKLNNPNVHYFICGKGPYEDKLKKLTKKLNVENNVHFLGFRSDIKELLNSCDVFILTSKQEGLARSLMEGMAAGLPCIVSNIRGNRDILEDGKGGYLVCTVDETASSIERLLDESLRRKMSAYNYEKILNYSVENITEDIKQVYNFEQIRGDCSNT